MKPIRVVASYVLRLFLWSACLVLLASASGCQWLDGARDKAEARYAQKLDELVADQTITVEQRDRMLEAFKDALDFSKPGWDWHQAVGDLVDALVLIFLGGKGAGAALRARQVLRASTAPAPSPAVAAP